MCPARIGDKVRDDSLLELGNLLRRHRLQRGWTQEELTGRTGFGPSVDTISNVERGRNRPRRHTLDELMAALLLSPTERDDVLRCWRASARRLPERGARPAVAEPSQRQRGGYLGALPGGSLVARAEELRQSLAHLETASRASEQLVLVDGAAGIGKTRLAQEIAVAAWDRGFLVASGRCYESQEAIPFYPFHELLEALLDHLPPEEMGEAGRRWPLLARILPEHVNARDDTSSGGHEEQHRLFRAVTGFVQSIARSRPVAIMIDDLHWADPASLELLLYLARFTRSERVFLLGTYRDVGLDRGHPLQAAIRDLIRDQLVEHVSLRPLDREETAALAAAISDQQITDRLLDLVYSATEGNPFMLQHVLQALRERAEAEQRPLDSFSDAIEAPDSVRLLIRQRMRHLSGKTRCVLNQGSVLGQRFGFAELEQMGQYGESELEQALDEAIGRGLVQELGRDTYTFDHTLTQASIYEELSSRRRQRLHRAAGEALERLQVRKRAGRDAEIARHFQLADNPERALIWMLRAGDHAAEMFAQTDAAKHYQAATELARELGDIPAEAEALEKLGEVLHRTGQYREAVEPLEQAAGIYRRLGNPDRYLRLTARSGEASGFAGRIADGLDRMLNVVRVVEAGEPEDWPSASLADLYAALCTLYLHAARVEDGLRTAGIAVSLAESSGNIRARCTAEISRGLAFGVLKRVDEERRAFERAAAIAEPLEDPWLLALAIYHQGVSYLAVDDFERGEQHVRRALDIAERAELIAWAAFARSRLSDLLVSRGRWAEARGEAARAVAENRFLGPRPGSSYLLVSLGRILLLQGERDEGLHHLHEALAVATRFEYLPGMISACETLAWQSLRDGNPEAATARIEPLLERSRAAGRPWCPLVYAWALLELDEVARAEEVLAGAHRQSMASRSRASLPDVLLHSAKFAARQKRWDDAVQSLEQGIAIAQEIELPYHEALLIEEYGRVEAARGKSERAWLHMDNALAIFRRLGAAVEVERADRSLSLLTSAIRSPSSTGDG